MPPTIATEGPLVLYSGLAGDFRPSFLEESLETIKWWMERDNLPSGVPFQLTPPSHQEMRWRGQLKPSFHYLAVYAL